MATEPSAAALRTLRKKSGLSQQELANLMGFQSRFTVHAHECSKKLPSLATALAYEAVFQVPISTIFPRLYRAVEAKIDKRFAELEQQLQERSAKGRAGVLTAKKLVFCCDRNDPEIRLNA